jgi:signal transduction histidine kinase
MTTAIARLVRLARPAWPVVASAGLALVVAAATAMPAVYLPRRGPHGDADFTAVHLTPGQAVGLLMLLTVVPTLVFFALAGIVRYRTAPDRMSLVCAYVLVLFGCGVVSPVPWVVFYGPNTLWGSPLLTAVGRLSTPVGLYAFGVFFAVFPSGRFVPGWLRWVVFVAGAGLVSGIVLAGFGHVGTASNLFQLTGFGILIVDAGAQIYRYRRVSTPTQRQQTKWVLLGLTGSVGIVVACQLAWTAVPARIARSQVSQTLDGAVTWQLAFLMIAVGIAVAILRYRLWDVDLVINRILLYTSLTACVAGIYVLVVGYLGRALRTDTTPWMSLIATGVVAVAIQPVRALLQRGINRLTYGQRDEPYAVVTQLGRRFAASALGDQPLAAIVETVAAALKLPYVAIAIRSGAGASIIAASHGTMTPDPLTLPLTYQSDPVGDLLAAPRRLGESLTPGDLRLLHDLARQIGPAVHAVSLTGDLQRSRERLVNAREEERRRLRRDLHDGLGPTLAGLALKAASIADQIPADPHSAQQTATDLYGEIRSTIGEVRRLVYGLRPPSLDELGLVGAVQEAARQHSRPGLLDISVVADGDLSALPAAVEVAAYRIMLESLTNVGKHAHARTCIARMTRGAFLMLEIIDDGMGIADGHPSGIGLLAIRERAAELGGSAIIEPCQPTGTLVSVRIPLVALESNDDPEGTNS